MEEELNLKELIISLWKNKIFIIVVTCIFAIIGLFMYKKSNLNIIEPKNENNKQISYEGKFVSQESFILGYLEKSTIIEEKNVLESGQSYNTIKNQKTQDAVNINDDLFETLNEILKSYAILHEVILELNLDVDVNELRECIVFNRMTKTKVLGIFVVYKDQLNAINILEKLIEKLEKEVKRIYNINSIIVLDDARIISEEEIISINEQNLNNTTENTAVITEDVRNNKLKLIIYPMIGFSLACGVIIVLEIFNNSVKNEKQLESYIKLKNLISLNNFKYNNNNDKFKFLRININKCKTILITSPEKNDGKTYVSINLARTFAKLNKKVVLIDLVKNENSLLTKCNGNGLLDYLQSDDECIEKYVSKSKIKNLEILTIGKYNENITELLESTKMKEALSTLEILYDVVIIDSQNILDSANTLAISKIAKNSILVVAERKTKLENIEKAKNNIKDIGGNVIGTVFNKLK